MGWWHIFISEFKSSPRSLPFQQIRAGTVGAGRRGWSRWGGDHLAGEQHSGKQGCTDSFGLGHGLGALGELVLPLCFQGSIFLEQNHSGEPQCPQVSLFVSQSWDVLQQAGKWLCGVLVFAVSGSYRDLYPAAVVFPEVILILMCPNTSKDWQFQTQRLGRSWLLWIPLPAGLLQPLLLARLYLTSEVLLQHFRYFIQNFSVNEENQCWIALFVLEWDQKIPQRKGAPEDPVLILMII